MNVHLPYDAPVKASGNGMGRFFSTTNLGRYRKLADDRINAAERDRVLKVLAEEWSAFTREYRTPIPVRACRGGVGLRNPGSK